MEEHNHKNHSTASSTTAKSILQSQISSMVNDEKKLASILASLSPEAIVMVKNQLKHLEKKEKPKHEKKLLFSKLKNNIRPILLSPASSINYGHRVSEKNVESVDRVVLKQGLPNAFEGEYKDVEGYWMCDSNNKKIRVKLSSFNINNNIQLNGDELHLPVQGDPVYTQSTRVTFYMPVNKELECLLFAQEYLPEGQFVKYRRFKLNRRSHLLIMNGETTRNTPDIRSII